ncbi:S66 peptidase family protein [Bailinhaonella thermotolerans]|uniref:LD-carboxypeptidase n=1 Tax=Bailinhaonella thermotolerans TaxID=1070861 RepID=A0A3A4B610_9ACTN|nr:LD-carboxypeptidase [Bailinhaonella thermotolerans]RJL36070.1 LD-carboxypeptidase [Bailinhaonella thermotolerans]
MEWDEGERAARTPAPLRPGDRVAVVAPCGPVDEVRLARGLAVLRDELGLDVVTGEHLRDRDGYLAGADEARAGDLQDAWCDPEVKAVFCARGGYGATRLLDLLDWDAMRAAAPKPLVGSSDVTALHAAFGRELGTATLFGPMPACATISDGEPEPRSLDHLRAALFDGGAPVTGDDALVPGSARGRLDGGNLALLAALCGTRYAPAFEGAVVLLEDVHEPPYRIDRMLTQLLAAGAFAGARGIVLGSWTDCGDEAALRPLFLDRLGGLGVPILAGVPIGHGSTQLSVWLGADVAIDTESFSMECPIRDRESAA